MPPTAGSPGGSAPVDAAHIRAAEAYFRYAPDDRKAALARRILARAREMGVDVRSRVIRGWAGEA